jgi:hypothetical protein
MQARVSLHAKWNTATFSCSHRCLPREVMVVRGVVQVTLRGVPANYLLRFFFRPPPLW